jgi:hypothetical protein
VYVVECGWQVFVSDGRAVAEDEKGEACVKKANELIGAR